VAWMNRGHARPDTSHLMHSRKELPPYANTSPTSMPAASPSVLTNMSAFHKLLLPTQSGEGDIRRQVEK